MAEAKEITVEEKLKKLYDLQKVMSQIDNLRAVRGELPLEVKDLEDEVAGLETRIANLDNDIKDLNFKINRHKSDIDLAKGQMKKYQDQQNTVRNNREYDNLAKEIEYQGLEIQLSEKRIKEGERDIENKTQELKSTEEYLRARRKNELVGEVYTEVASRPLIALSAVSRMRQKPERSLRIRSTRDFFQHSRESERMLVTACLLLQFREMHVVVASTVFHLRESLISVLARE